MLTITTVIVIITSITSFMAFSNQNMIDKLIFYPPAINRDKEWYRFFSNGLIHADMQHLLFNMISLYSFGRFVERDFNDIFGNAGKVYYTLMYVSALAICLIPTYIKQKDNYYYRSLGASGAVSAVIFAGLFLEPTLKIWSIIPGFLFGPIYLIMTGYLIKQGRDNINHSAHFWGSLYGLIFILATGYALSQYDLVATFIQNIRDYISF